MSPAGRAPECRVSLRAAGRCPTMEAGVSSRNPRVLVRGRPRCEQAEEKSRSSVPVYEYACTACGERLEARQSFTDDPLTECPVCSGRLRKVLSPVGVVFKGSGFYRTDSRKS